jgi:hypothetical protein
MNWRLGVLSLGLAAVACGGAVAGSDNTPDAGADSGGPIATQKRSVRADKLGEVCTIENDCGKPEVCANFDAVDIYARGALCSPPDPCSLVKCLDGEVCIVKPGRPIVVECQ